MPLRIGISGFGRIGRCLFRYNHETDSKKFKIAAIKDIQPIENMVYLLRFDSHYGEFQGRIGLEGNNLVINGTKIPYYNEKDSTKIPWAELGVNILIEASGSVFQEDIDSIIRGDLTNIMYVRNFEGADITIIYGVNHNQYNPKKDRVISASTCTGNAIVPIAEIIDNKLGIECGQLISIHPVLSDQKLVDVSHEKYNLGRNAMNSIIPTSTGIIKSLSRIFPHLKGRLSGISYRVPTTVVSVIDANFRLKKETSLLELNTLLKEHAKKNLEKGIEYDEGYMGHSKVSIDFLKNPHAVIISSLDTRVEGKNISLTLFHDNEWGYCVRVHKLLNYIHQRNLEYEEKIINSRF